MTETIPISASRKQTNQLPILWTLLTIGLLLRVVLLIFSKGSTDAFIWERLASEVSRIGLYQTYVHEGGMNHPPLAALWAALVYRLSGWTGLPFYTLFKIPVVLSDFVVCGLFFQIYRSRHGTQTGLLAAAAFAWSLNAILLSAHHCNTDSIYTMLCLAALWLAECKRRPFLSGLALGAAINIKLIPTLLIIPLLGLSRSRKDLLRTVAGLAIAALPFVWMLIDLGYRFRMRVLGYQPAPGNWGIYQLIEWLGISHGQNSYLKMIASRYADNARLLIFAAILLLTLLLRRSPKPDLFRAGAATVMLFAVLTPSFALQYGAIVGVMLFAYDLRCGVWWSALRGMQLFCDYYLGWDSHLPITSLGGGGLHVSTAVFALLTWLYTVALLIREAVSHQDKLR